MSHTFKELLEQFEQRYYYHLKFAGTVWTKILLFTIIFKSYY